MSVLVTDTGFSRPDDREFVAPEEAAADASALELDPGADAGAVLARHGAARAIGIVFSSFADGRGFTLARELRQAGFAGWLVARGPLLPDQYAMARRCGFDAVEIDDDLAARATEPQWLARADWQADHYQRRLRAGA